MNANEAVDSEISFILNSDVSSYSSDTLKGLYETTWLSLVLHGLRNSFNRVLKSSSVIEYTFTDRFKEQLLQSNTKLKYPYAYIVINDIDLVKDQQNTAAASRRALNTKKLHGESVAVSFLFPFKMNITLNVLDSDVNSLLALTQSIFLADVFRGFNFGVKAFNSLEKVKVQRTGNISFSEATINTEQENDFGTGHITCTFEVQGNLGFTSLEPTIKNIKMNVFTDPTGLGPRLPDGSENPSIHLEFSYNVSVSEDENGAEHINKLYISPSG